MNKPQLPRDNQFYTPPGGPPQVERPNPAIYEAMGEEHIFRMTRDFYAALEQSEIRNMFAEDMPAASRKLGAFFVGILGGPPLYQQQYGSPRLRERHLPFSIGERERAVWMGCLRATLADAPAKYHFPEEHLPGFVKFVEAFSFWMVNRQP